MQYYKAVIRFKYNQYISKTIQAVLEPELQHQKSLPRTEVNLVVGEDSIQLNINAEDLSALRAGLNSYLRWIALITQLINYIGNEGRVEK